MEMLGVGGSGSDSASIFPSPESVPTQPRPDGLVKGRGSLSSTTSEEANQSSVRKE